MLAQEILRSF